jgi:hypothetical protein
MKKFQAKVNERVPVPPGALDIKDYKAPVPPGALEIQDYKV